VSRARPHNSNREASFMTDKNKKSTGSTRREFLATTAAVAGVAMTGLPAEAAAKRHPKRGGTLRFGTRSDAISLDTHRNFV
jgi:peptide/nickel transport system substrate-binding protein